MLCFCLFKKSLKSKPPLSELKSTLSRLGDIGAEGIVGAGPFDMVLTGDI